MFIDYLPLLLINMAAGLVILASYLKGCLSNQQDKGWAAAFYIVGAIAFFFGMHMTLTWPLPASYNVAFGETSILFGALFLAAGFSIANGYSLLPVALYAFFAGTTAIVLGLRIINLHLTQAPLLSGAGFILTGLGGILLLPALRFSSARWMKILVAVILVAAALLWIYTGCTGYWAHLKNFAQWKPVTMR